MALLQVICFSMDRVFQLSEYLRTLQRHVRYCDAAWDAQPQFARAAVICRCSSPEIRAHYEALERRHAPRGVRFLYESETRSFADCLLLGIASGGDGDGADGGASATPRFVLFNVDDAFYFDDVELADAFAFLDGDSAPPRARPFAFHIKLAPSIWRSHLTNKSMLPLPPIQTIVRSQEASVGDTGPASDSGKPFEMAYHVFDPARGTLDWNYPWELSGSVYLRSTVEDVVAEIRAAFGTKGINHPNHLELRGHQVLARWKEAHAIERLQCACSVSPKMHVFAINQVQDVFNNRLYEDEVRGVDTHAGDVTNLLRLYEAGETLDEAFYRRNRLSSVHIGTLVLKPRDSTRTAVSRLSDLVESPDSPLVSVVIPVFNVAKYIGHALQSIMNQTYRHLEIIVVDDASTDATSKTIAELQAQDPRIRVVQNATNLGVAASLNKGFAAAQGEFIARMDGDDVSVLSRIERQLAYLRENPQVAIAGASMLILRENENPAARFHETAVYPTSPLVTKWRMLFGCFVGHPTVMMRREVLETLTGGDSREVYSTSQRSSEDYELWLRCLYSHKLTIQSMGDVLVIHRKHGSNVSKVRRESQIAETREIATRFIQDAVDGSSTQSSNGSIITSATQVQPLFDVNLSKSADTLRTAIKVLHKLQAAICARPNTSSKAEEAEHECEQAYVAQDAASREGELALQSMLLDPIAGSQMWSVFASRHPEMSRGAFERLFTKK